MGRIGFHKVLDEASAVAELVRSRRIPSLTTGALPTDQTGDLICETLETVTVPA